MSDHLEGISKIPTSLPSRLILEYLIQGNSDFDWSPAEEGSERNEKERIPKQLFEFIPLLSLNARKTASASINPMSNCK